MGEHAWRMPLHTFARKQLFEPPGIADAQWRQGPQVEGFGRQPAADLPGSFG
jgi:hypothetical protein